MEWNDHRMICRVNDNGLVVHDLKAFYSYLPHLAWCSKTAVWRCVQEEGNR